MEWKSDCLSVGLSICLSICLSVTPSVCLSVCLYSKKQKERISWNEKWTACLCVFKCVCMSLYMYVCVCVCMYVYLCLYYVCMPYVCRHNLFNVFGVIIVLAYWLITWSVYGDRKRADDIVVKVESLFPDITEIGMIRWGIDKRFTLREQHCRIHGRG